MVQTFPIHRHESICLSAARARRDAPRSPLRVLRTLEVMHLAVRKLRAHLPLRALLAVVVCWCESRWAHRATVDVSESPALRERLERHESESISVNNCRRGPNGPQRSARLTARYTHTPASPAYAPTGRAHGHHFCACARKGPTSIGQGSRCQRAHPSRAERQPAQPAARTACRGRAIYARLWHHSSRRPSRPLS